MRYSHVMGALVGATLALFAIPGCQDGGISVDGIQPERGSHHGGDRVTIQGKGFEDAPGMTIYFGQREVRSRRIIGDRSIVVTTPHGSPGESVDVQIIFDDARQILYEDAFTYVDSGDDYRGR